MEIKLKTTNQAFEFDIGSEVGRILIDLGEKIRDGQQPSVLVDINGNSVGWVNYDK